MSRRFGNLSKYRNSVVSAAKRENCFQFASASGAVHASGTDPCPIKATPELVAFRAGTGGAAVGILPLSSTGRIDTPPQLHNGSAVSDIDWARWHANDAPLLGIGGEDGVAKLWSVPRSGLPAANDPNGGSGDGNGGVGGVGAQLLATLPAEAKRIENVLFHPTAQDLLAISSGGDIRIWNVQQASAAALVLDGGCDHVQTLSWKDDGALLASIGKDNLLRVYDPRSGKTSVKSVEAHNGIKPSRVVWAGVTDMLFSTGFNARRDREYAVWDVRNLAQPLVMNKVDTSPGILTPLYDADTGMLFLAGKGDTNIRWLELKTDNPSAPVDASGIPFTSNTSFTGACLVPKLGLDVMECEVARILSVASDGSGIVPVSAVVPRKTHADFHGDIFPDTRANEAALSASEWLAGETKIQRSVTLDPAKRAAMVTKAPPSIAVNDRRSVSAGTAASSHGQPPPVSMLSTYPSPSATSPAPISMVAPTPTNTPAVSIPTPSSAAGTAAAPTAQPPAGAFGGDGTGKTAPTAKFVSLPKHSPYRFVAGKPSAEFEDLKGLSINLPNESDAFQANTKFLAFAMAGPGGRIGIWPTSQKGRLPARIPCIVNGSDLLDFKFDPFNENRVLTACDDGRIRTFILPDGGLAEDLIETQDNVLAHNARVVLALFHPTASDVVLTYSPEMGTPLIKLWNLRSKTSVASMALPDQALSMAFSPTGDRLAVVVRDKTIRTFNCRTGEALQQGPAHDGAKAARVVWMGDTGRLLSVGFARGSQREIIIYDASNLGTPLSSTTLDTSPALLLPTYDQDTGLLVLAGRGESVIPFYDMLVESTESAAKPVFLTRYSAPNGVQQTSLVLLPKRTCDVRAIEVLKGYRLTPNGIESISFTVPRLQKEYFQDDIFKPTRNVEKAAVTADAWVGGASGELDWIDLRPADMVPLSQVVVEKKVDKKAVSMAKELSEAERKEATMRAMFDLALEESKQGPLPQDMIEGVEDDEWD
ncbi:hypothetical protein BC831DRAFT_499742 [Entophlyctis helioformis]|nr:hypothetical protein BC831DRAFT_499742 [Entophlyctis helioformis]